MLNLKKVIALVCVFALALTTVAFGATYTDVAEDSAYYEAVETLNKLGIVNGYEDGTFKPEDGVTRAEMAKLIACIQGYGETAKANANTAFTDVPASHWASGYIANAAGMGIINGYGDGNFGPEDPVLYEQAVKMVMATLGYTPFAEKNGGYPTGYLAAAQRYNVSLAVANAAVGSQANRGTVAQLLENALDTALMIQKEWNTNGEVVYEIAEGKYDNNLNRTVGYKTLMSENLGYIKLRGEVNGTTIAQLDSAKTTFDVTEDAFVTIDITDDYGTENKTFLDNAVYNTQAFDAVDFLVGDTDAEDYLGQAIIAYAKVNAKDEFELVSVAVDSNRNNVMTIPVGQFVDYDATNDEILYYKEGATQVSKVGVDNTLKAVYNGTGMAAASALDETNAVNPLYGGEIKLIDRDEDKEYDVAIVTVATTGVVKKVAEGGVTFQKALEWANGTGGTVLEIDAEATDKFIKIYKDGVAIEAAELAEWDVLSLYAYDEWSDIITAEVIGTQVVGTITSTKTSKTSATTKAYSVDGTWYDAAKGVYGSSDLDISEGGTFYIDQFGKIAAFVEDAALAGGAVGNYGYVLDVKASEADFGAAGKAVIKVQILTADGVEVLTIKNNAKLNGPDDYLAADLGTDPDSIALDVNDWTVTKDASGNITGVTGGTYSAAYAKLTGTDVKAAVVKYTKDANGYIGSITVKGHDNDDLKLVDTGSSADYEYDADVNKFDSATDSKALRVEDDAIVFIVDTDPAQCRVGSLADLDDKNVYDIDKWYTNKKANKVNMLVVQEDSIDTNTTDSIALVLETSIGVDEAGETIWTIKYLQDGTEVTATTTADVAFTYSTAPTRGDIVKVKIGSADTITKLTKVYDFIPEVRKFKGTGHNDVATLTGSYTGDEKYYGGYVTAYDEDTMEISIDTDKDFTADKVDLWLDADDVNVYTVDATGNSIVIKNGGSFRYFEGIYGSSNIKVIDVYDKLDDAIAGGFAANSDGEQEATFTMDGTDNNDAIKITDHVYVREYDGVVTDVVIVKGATIKVR